MRKLLILFIMVSLSFVFAQDIIVELDTSANIKNLSKGIEVDGITYYLNPLLENSRSRRNWYIASPNKRVSISSWDMAHKLVSQHRSIIYAEPDEVQVKSYNEQGEIKEDSQALEKKKQKGYNTDWPHPSKVDLCWHLKDKFSQLGTARSKVQIKGKKIRIAHFDTGYSPNHITTPKYLATDLQKNFVKGENPNSAVDIGSEGLLKQPGHGTSTIGVLAGNIFKCPSGSHNDYIGGAPLFEIVPIRLSKSVVLFKTSAFVKAVYYAIDIKCDVISMSMGGVASKYWAEAVNDAYNQGVVIVTAAGNNFGKKPTRYTVYPARFNRVISACGITYNNTPYYKYGLLSFKMQGNYGPDSVMGSAIASYTPNIVWAEMEDGSVHLSGGGTSAATPQVAAAAALWLQKYNTFSYQHPWQRVNAVRNALFSSAEKGYKDSKKYYGNGVLKAVKALNVAPKLFSKQIKKDKVRFPYLTVLLGWKESDEMFEVEMAQLQYSSLVIQEVSEAFEKTQKITPEQREKVINEVINMPQASEKLKEAMKYAK